MKLGAAYDKATDMGPVVNQGHKQYVLDWIETGHKTKARISCWTAATPKSRRNAGAAFS